MDSRTAPWRRFALFVLAVAVVGDSAATAGTIHPIAPNAFVLTNELRAEDAAIVRTLPKGSTLRIAAWGGSVEAWLAAVAISDAAAERNLKIAMDYAEDAAIGIYGPEGVQVLRQSRWIAYTPVPLLDTRMQAAASVVERFEAACGGPRRPIPKKAPRQTPKELAGFLWDRPETVGVRANPDQRWFFDSAKAKPPNWHWWYRHRSLFPDYVVAQRPGILRRVKGAIERAERSGLKMPSPDRTEDERSDSPPPAQPDAGRVAPSAPQLAPPAAKPPGWSFKQRMITPLPALSKPGSRLAKQPAGSDET